MCVYVRAKKKKEKSIPGQIDRRESTPGRKRNECAFVPGKELIRVSFRELVTKKCCMVETIGTNLSQDRRETREAGTCTRI